MIPPHKTSPIGLSYVNELKRMKETFIDPLLHTFSPTPVSPQSNTPRSITLPDDPRDHDGHSDPRPSESSEQLYAASLPTPPPVPFRSTIPIPQQTKRNVDLGDYLAEGVPLTTSNEDSTKGAVIEEGDADDYPEIPDEFIPEPASLPHATQLRLVPKDLQVCLETVENDLLYNHTRFSKALNTRWEQHCTPAQPIEDILVEYVRYLSPFVCHRLTVSASPIF